MLFDIRYLGIVKMNFLRNYTVLFQTGVTLCVTFHLILFMFAVVIAKCL